MAGTPSAGRRTARSLHPRKALRRDDELCSLADLPRRTARFYIQEGLVDRPEGAKRGAYYTRGHLEQLLTIRRWQRAGLSLERIRELVAKPVEGTVLPPERPRRPGDVTVRSHVFLRPGVELEQIRS